MQDLPFNTRVLTRHNNLNFLRFIAAFSVIFSHSFTVSEGSGALGTPLDVITQKSFKYRWYCCCVFLSYQWDSYCKKL